MIHIDGGEGEGGGQMLRTSLSLSLITGHPFEMENVRAGRKKPGLLRQHLAAVLAAAEISGAAVEGAQLGSQHLSFRPAKVKPGEYRFVIGTAGSATLVFQTVLPALMLASGPSIVTVEGGTHNESAPPFEFLNRTFLPFVRRMGPQVELTLERYGFYPAGGGCLRALIQPSSTLTPLHIGVRGPIAGKLVTAVVANLPAQIARREIDTVQHMFAGTLQSSVVEANNSPGPGNVVMLEIESAVATETFTAFGKLGVTAENVAREAVREARSYLVSDAAAGEHLTDQLLLPFALSGGGSFTAQKCNSHSATNIEIIERFLPVRFSIEDCGRHTAVGVQATGR